MSFSYPKIWTCILSEPWFVKRSLNAKGLFLVMLVMAKGGTDNGEICTRSISELAQLCGTNRNILSRLVSGLVADGKLEILEKSPTCYRIKIVNYNKWQELGPRDVKSHMVPGSSKNDPSLSQPVSLINNKINKQINNHPGQSPVSGESNLKRKIKRIEDMDDHEEGNSDDGGDELLKRLANPLAYPSPPLDQSLITPLKPPKRRG